MGYINYKILKHELPDNMQWLKNRTILLTRTGSHAYGTNTPESDEDYRGVCIPPPEYYLGLKSINEYNTSGGKNFVTNGPEDIDITVTHINKFVRDALNGVPNNLDILFCRDEDIIYIDDFGKELRAMKKNFLSKALKHKFCGYAHAQKHKLIIKKGNGTGRQELVEKYGYDTKFAMHAVRLLTSVIEILETHDYQTYRQNREWLLEIRNGKYTLEEIFEILDELEARVEELYVTSDLPEHCDYNKINDWLIDINRKALDYNFCCPCQDIDKK